MFKTGEALIDFYSLFAAVLPRRQSLGYGSQGRASMKTESDRFSTASEGSIVGDLLRSFLLFLWCVIRVPLLIVLGFLEPFVRVVLIGIAILTVITAFVFEGSSARPAIPLWMMLCIATACVLLVAAYHGLLRLLSR